MYFSQKMVLRHALFRSEVGVVDRSVFVGVVLLTGQFGIVQPTRVAQRPRAVGSATPLRSLSSVAAVASARWCGAASALLGIGASKTCFGVFEILRVSWHQGLGICLLLLSLLGCLLVVRELLSIDDLADFRKRIKLKT